LNSTADAVKQFKRLDGSIQRVIIKYLDKVAQDPMVHGYWLRGDLTGLRKYRISKDYRVIASMQKDKLVILVVKVGHRSTVYEE